MHSKRETKKLMNVPTKLERKILKESNFFFQFCFPTNVTPDMHTTVMPNYNNVESNEIMSCWLRKKKNWGYSIIQLELYVQPYANSKVGILFYTKILNTIANKPQHSRPILIEIGYALKHILIA